MLILSLIEKDFNLFVRFFTHVHSFVFLQLQTYTKDSLYTWSQCEYRDLGFIICLILPSFKQTMKLKHKSAFSLSCSPCHDPAGGRITVLLSLCAPVDLLQSDKKDTLPKLEQLQNHHFFVCSGILLNISFCLSQGRSRQGRLGNGGLELCQCTKLCSQEDKTILFSESGHVYPSEISLKNILFTTDHSKCGFDVEHTSKLPSEMHLVLQLTSLEFLY